MDECKPLVVGLSLLLTSMVAVKTYVNAQDLVGRCRLTLSNPS